MIPVAPSPYLPYPPQPLIRLTQTVNPPWEGADPITLEVIVIAAQNYMGDDDTTAAHSDLPELQQAGWSCRDSGALQVWTRVIS